MLDKGSLRIGLVLGLMVVAGGCKSHTQWNGAGSSSSSTGGGIGSWFANGRDPASSPSGSDFYPSNEIGPVSMGKR
jgi:hypothetical protein